MMAILLVVYPLEGMARRPLVRIHHSNSQAHGISPSVRDSYEASRKDRARRDARDNVLRAQDSLERADSRALRIQSDGPNSQSPNSHYRDLMDAQGDKYRAQSDLREKQNQEYWERRR